MMRNQLKPKNGTLKNGNHLEELKRWYDSLPEKEKEKVVEKFSFEELNYIVASHWAEDHQAKAPQP